VASVHFVLHLCVQGRGVQARKNKTNIREQNQTNKIWPHFALQLCLQASVCVCVCVCERERERERERARA
jgi:hypothetical protein